MHATCHVVMAASQTRANEKQESEFLTETSPCSSKLPKSCHTHTLTHTRTSDCTVSTLECISFKFLYRSGIFNFKWHFYGIINCQHLCYIFCTSGMCKPQTYTSAKTLKFLQLDLQVHGLGWHQDWQWRHSHCESIAAGKLKFGFNQIH